MMMHDGYSDEMRMIRVIMMMMMMMMMLIAIMRMMMIVMMMDRWINDGWI